MNIPIYRAKKIDSGEWVEGYYMPFYSADGVINYDADYIYYKDYFNTNEPNLGFYWTNSVIDPNTLAIHFPNMIDKNGKKIFASLSEDGVGGDIIVNGLSTTYYPRPLFFTSSGMFINSTHPLNRIKDFSIYEVIGIHKGEINENATP